MERVKPIVQWCKQMIWISQKLQLRFLAKRKKDFESPWKFWQPQTALNISQAEGPIHSKI
jgi:hypothetical protein